MGTRKSPQRMDFDMGLGPEDEGALLEEAGRVYRAWMRIIREDSPREDSPD